VINKQDLALNNLSSSSTSHSKNHENTKPVDTGKDLMTTSFLK
jgi:hypothetical protein